MLDSGRILEGIVTTCDGDGQPHIAPMGPIVDDTLTRLRLRPFQTSTTFLNLQRSGVGVFHITDDVNLLARAAVGKLEQLPKVYPAQKVSGWILADCCRWFEFHVTTIDASQPRSEILAEVVSHGHRRDFFGFNRAMHAVLELAILATRIDLVSPDFLLAEIERLMVIVEKTAGPNETRAFSFLNAHLREAIAKRSIPSRDDNHGSGGLL